MPRSRAATRKRAVDRCWTSPIRNAQNEGMTLTAREIYARTYDSAPFDWPGELEGYRRWARETSARPRILELACGTGRIAIPLADDGAEVTGLDRSPAMIEVAQKKRPGGNPAWVVADMRFFDLGRRFDLVIIPAHSFQFMTSADDQVAALTATCRHLEPGGRLVVHLDRPGPDWQAALPATPPPPEARSVDSPRLDPATGLEWRMRSAWALDLASEVATLHRDWIRTDTDDAVTEVVPEDPMEMKIIGRVEMEHALARAGFRLQAVHGDFAGGPLLAASDGMIFVAAAPGR